MEDSSGKRFDLKSQFDIDLRTKLNIILSKRHVIVHNNGLADKKYNDHVGPNYACKRGEVIPIAIDEIKECFITVNTFTKKVKNTYDSFCRLDFEENFDTRIRKDRNIVQYLPVKFSISSSKVGCHATAVLVKANDEEKHNQ